MEVHLPVHQSPGHQEFFDGIDAFFLHHQGITLHGQHLQDPVVADGSFDHAGEETVAGEVVHPIHVQLSAHELVQEALRVGVAEDVDRRLQFTIAFRVQFFHDQQGDGFVAHFRDHDALQGMGERAVADVVQEDGDAGALFLFRTDVHAFGPEFLQGQCHQMIGAQGVVQAGMHGARINEMGQRHLRDPAQALAPWMRHHPVHQGIVEGDKAVHRVIDDLAERHLVWICAAKLRQPSGYATEGYLRMLNSTQHVTGEDPLGR